MASANHDAALTAALTIEVVYCPRPGVVDRVSLRLQEGATLVDALHASGLLQRHQLGLEGLRAGIWGKVRALDASLRDRDRVEVYRALTVDPKEARRLRYKRHKESTKAR